MYLNEWSRVPLGNLIDPQPVNEFPTLYGYRRFIAVFARTLHLSVSRARSIQSTPSHPISLSLIFTSSHLLLGLPTGRFYFKFSHQNPMCISVFSHTCHMPSPSDLRCSYGRDEFVSRIREHIHTESV